MKKKKILERAVFDNENTNVYGEPGVGLATAGKFLKKGTLVVPTTDPDTAGGALFFALDNIGPNEGFSGTIKLGYVIIEQELPAGYMPGDSIGPTNTLDVLLTVGNSATKYGYFTALGDYGDLDPTTWASYTIDELYVDSFSDAVILDFNEKIIDSVLGEVDTISLIGLDIGAPVGALDLTWSGTRYTATSNAWMLYISGELAPPFNLRLAAAYTP